ncbi:unnamed protein product [Cuscuta campestris]|uniref:non-specific serine/threonine protein kinase n=1 Tax=Cuscuta campestris TaxID=132261 RepID=A0A484M0Z5_9ASTE|nr:unnamed protein product [Cuscuta campestris]
MVVAVLSCWVLAAESDDQARLLVAFRESSVEKDPNGFLKDWDLPASSSSSGGHCDWSGVTCSPDRRQVTAVDLGGARLVGFLHIRHLLALPALRDVNLSGNRFYGNLSLSDCRSLSLLNLSKNNLSGSLEISLSSCPTLSALDLSYNNFSGNLNDGVEFGDCRNLYALDLSFNGLTATDFPASLENCERLERLDLGHNAIRLKLPGKILAKLRSARRLGLDHNQFFGEVPSELGEICAGVAIEELDLSGNELTGGLPTTFASCSSLASLNLSRNHLTGDFLSSVVSHLTNLRRLSVSFNNLTGPIPRSLERCSKLEVLDLSSNELDGEVPSWFCSGTAASGLQMMLLANNRLSGEIPAELGLCKSLAKLDLSFNGVRGSIPSDVWNLPNLSDLIMWANGITGEIPEGICTNGGARFQTLILNHNSITGQIPESISKCTDLVWISLSSNQLTGDIPPGISELSELAILQLGNNSLSGPIPPGLGKCKSLIWLDLNSNDLTGPIPAELADRAGLIVPGAVSGKHFAFVRNEGGSMCRGPGGLVDFQGIREEVLENFPVFNSCPSIRVYSGTTIYTFSGNGSMIYLDLSYNSLSGSIPASLGSMGYLQVLNLGHNDLTGTIPPSLGDLKKAGVLDASHNHLQGLIPGSLGGLSFLNDLDLSNNNLSGQIPSGGQLITFPSSRYENNSGLCGLPLAPCGSRSGPRHEDEGKKKKTEASTVWMFAGIALSFICLCGLLVALFRVKSAQERVEKRDKYIESLSTSCGSSSWKLSSVPEPLSINVATFEKPLRKLTFAHLLEATNGFSKSSLVGSGGFGEVYKAHLKDGSVVAIKKLIHVTGQGDREFMAEMETIGKIKHRNLVPLLGYCKVGDERLLVYEYMKWGSLEDVLHNNRDKNAPSLGWAARKKIAVGSARGLAFLHHSCLPHIIHRDMKSSNVLVDDDLEARVSDFGMARLVNALDTHLSVSTLAGTPGYVPPEYYQSFRCTTKGDVYSFGVILLELLSGKKPINTQEFGDDNNLVSWAKLLHKSKRSDEIFDPQLVADSPGDSDDHHRQQLHEYLKIAFACLEEKPYQRPTMIQVMAMFRASSSSSMQLGDCAEGHDGAATVLIHESPEGGP